MQMQDVDIREELKKKEQKAAEQPVATKVVTAPQPPVGRDGDYILIDKLPSRSMTYPVGTQVYGRPLKVLEVKRLAALTARNNNAVINDVLRKATKGIDVDDMLISDKIFLLLWLRAQTFPASGYVVEFDCPLCEQKSSYEFSMSAVEVSFLGEQFDVTKDFTFTIPNFNDTITYHFATVGDERRKEAFLSSVQKNAIKEFNEELLGVAMMIDTINGEKKGLGDKYEYLIKCDPTAYAYIESVLFKNDFGINPNLSVRCGKCGENVRTLITFDSDFFLPKYQFERPA